MIHAFQKRSRKGIATSQRDVDLARDRIKRLKAQLMTGDLERVRGSGNVWHDCGCPDVRHAEYGSRVRNADYGRFTLDRLIRILHALDQQVEVAVTVRPRDEPLPVSTQP
jgi:hypothetical protein